MAGEWVDTTLGDLIDIEHGCAFQGEYFHDEPPGDVLLTPGNFAIGGGFKTDKFKYYRGPVPSEFVLGEGDLLVTMTDLSKATDTLGYPALVPPPVSGARFLHNQRLGKVVIKTRAPVEKSFLYYLLCSREYRNEVLASVTGTTVKHTSPNRIKRFQFQRPPIPDQRAIAHILGTLDDKIELNRRMNETLEAMAWALFKSWFVDFDPVRAKHALSEVEGAEGRPSTISGQAIPGLPKHLADLFPDSFEDSELGEIPKGWKVGTVDEEFNLTMGQSPPGDTYNETGEGLPFFQGRTDFGFRFPARRVYCTAPSRLAEAGDTLVSVRAPVGDVNMAAERCCIGRGVAAVRHKLGSCSYTYYFMKSQKEVFDRFEAEGTVFGSINKNDFHALQNLVPSSNVTAAFERTVSPLDDGITNKEKEANTLAAIRDALLQKLLSGEIQVKDAEKFVGAIS